jgi:ABC-type bacteriocin/lantibiotic exporter with double-glycine peptidase domain
MTSDNTDSKQRSFLKVIYRFLGGATVGTLVLLIPVTYGTFNDLGLVQAGVASLLVILCGLLSIVWGEKFIDVVMRMLNGTGL